MKTLYTLSAMTLLALAACGPDPGTGNKSDMSAPPAAGQQENPFDLQDPKLEENRRKEQEYRQRHAQ
jgi:hypothetical protein